MNSALDRLSKQRRYLFAVMAGLVYGLTLRLILHGPRFWSKGETQHQNSSLYPTDLWVMTFGFLIVAPFVMGWISISSGNKDHKYQWAHWIFTPWLSIIISDLCFMLTGIEGSICVIFALPITLVISSIGGISVGLARRRDALQARSVTLCLAVVPFILSAIETQLDAPLEIRTVQTKIVIHAPAATVWKTVERVSPISPTELQPTWTHRIGFPLPVEATLDHEGIGGVRHASFQGGLLFVETIKEWQPLQTLGFSIAADTAHIPSTTLDEHVTIGGRFFDVLDGEYRLEPLPNGDILLHLSSRERLSTDFNAYAALWTDAVMRDLQVSILQVVKQRCESGQIARSATVNP